MDQKEFEKKMHEPMFSMHEPMFSCIEIMTAMDEALGDSYNAVNTILEVDQDATFDLADIPDGNFALTKDILSNLARNKVLSMMVDQFESACSTKH